MKETIIKNYTDLYAKSADFRAFCTEMDKYTIEEEIALFDINKDIISYCFEVSRKQDNQ